MRPVLLKKTQQKKFDVLDNHKHKSKIDRMTITFLFNLVQTDEYDIFFYKIKMHVAKKRSAHFLVVRR